MKRQTQLSKPVTCSRILVAILLFLKFRILLGVKSLNGAYNNLRGISQEGHGHRRKNLS